MRCLYCGKELALLKRLTGGGDFCSDSHKQSYQEEYNRLALSRLLQAQTKGHQSTKAPAQHAAPPADVSVAVEEPLPELVSDQALNETLAHSGLETAPIQTLAGTEPVAAEELYAPAVDEEAASGSNEPLETVGFLLESPAFAPPDESPYLETPYADAWLELSPGPAMSEWKPQNGATFNLSSANLLALDLRPNASSIEYAPIALDSSPQSFPGVPPKAPLSAVRNAKQRQSFPHSGSVAIDLALTSVAAVADRSFVQAIPFQSTVLIEESRLLELPGTGIEFPAADSDVVVLLRSHYNGTAPVSMETDRELAAEDDSPRSSLEALSRLHGESAEPETTTPETTTDLAPQTEPNAEPAEAVLVGFPLAEAGAAVEPAAETAKPRFSTDLFEISVKTFPPAKPVLIGGDAFPNQTGPLIPNLKGLPLRPKVGLARDYVPPSNASAPAETKPAAPAATPARTQPPSKPAHVAKPSARLTQPKQPSTPVKPAAAAVASKPAPPKVEAPKPVAKTVAAPPAPVPEASAAAPEVSEATPKAPSAEKAPAVNQPKPVADQIKPKPAVDQTKPAADQPKPAADQAKPTADQPKPAADQPKPTADQAKPTADQANKDNVPNFGLAQPANTSWLGSLKVKLGLAILILVIACVYFLGWGGKASKAASSNPAVANDGSGPSIIMGEGGWVEGWGGDPKGIQAGREITIYRPSLKLSDYRLEFQGSIDSKSIGWVFRASDPENYYAMKLMTVSSGLASKVALFKYLVANGKQTQVGRVPIDLAVQPDTVFNVRVDIRGPHFTTYIQGQQVDSWTDDQLKIGGVGFLNERDERGKVKSVSIRYLSGAAK